MSDLIAMVSLFMMFLIAVLYVRSCDHLKGAC
jgi:hypothetical protein